MRVHSEKHIDFDSLFQSLTLFFHCAVGFTCVYSYSFLSGFLIDFPTFQSGLK